MSEIQNKLSRRERQIMDILIELSEASANQVMARLPNAPGYSAVRALLSKMETKKIIDHKEDGARYIYYPTITREQASSSAIKRLLKTFFDGSAVAAVNTIISQEEASLTPGQIEELEKLIERTKAKTKGNRKNE